MAEVKSTLDLVLEKTRNLKLSEAEKEAGRRKEYLDSLNGVLQKHLDGVLSLEDATKKIAGLKTRFGLDERPVLRDLIFDRLDLDGENKPLIELIRRMLKFETKGVEQVFQAYRTARGKALHKGSDEILKTLQRKYGISGSAVLPNPAKNPQVKGTLQKLEASFKTALFKEVERLKQPSCP